MVITTNFGIGDTVWTFFSQYIQKTDSHFRIPISFVVQHIEIHIDSGGEICESYYDYPDINCPSDDEIKNSHAWKSPYFFATKEECQAFCDKVNS